MATSLAATVDFRQKVTAALIRNIEEGDGLPWDKGYDNGFLRPFNPTTGLNYKGGNIINLLAEQDARESDDPRWMTFKQAKSVGCSIRKGAKAAQVEYWDWSSVNEQDKDRAPDNETTTDSSKRKARVFYASVFNGVDVVGIPELKREAGWKPNDLAEQLIAKTGVVIEYKSSIPSYRVNDDQITMSPKHAFKTEGDYYATLLHELAHWSGHPNRLARLSFDQNQVKGSPEYAKEELRAEIASMFLCSMIGVDGTVQNHAKYTAHWLNVLKEDKHEIFRAARDAEAIVAHIFDYAPELRYFVESRLSNNMLLKADVPPQELSGKIKALPNTMPTDEAGLEIPTGVGRNDSRWPGFDSAVRTRAQALSIGPVTIEEVMKGIEDSFTDVMNTVRQAAVSKGLSNEDMNNLLADKVINEMQTANLRQQQWDRLVTLVHGCDAPHQKEQIEAALHQLHDRYRSVIRQSSEEHWSKDHTDAAILNVVYGDEGRRPITSEYVSQLIAQNQRHKITDTPPKEPDDDFVLTPLAVGQSPVTAQAVSTDNSEDGQYLMDADISG
jgi:antirestriction protein ArdC